MLRNIKRIIRTTSGHLLERLDARVGQQVDLQVGLCLEQLAALVAHARAGRALAVDLAEVAPERGARAEHGGARLARVRLARRRRRRAAGHGAEARAVVCANRKASGKQERKKKYKKKSFSAGVRDASASGFY